MQKLNIAILGASGYTGAELIRLLMNHPHANITLLTGDSQAGKAMGEVYPHLRFAGLPALISMDKAAKESENFKNIDLICCCLPHGTTQEVIAKLPTHLKIIDLSADFRLENPESYKEWYGHAHQALDMQKEAVYGLTEHARAEVKKARLVANPGCYPTSVQLPLIPLLKEKLIDPNGIIIDAKSGMTGAGRAAQQNHLYTEISEGVSAYSIGSHRHAPEIEQGLSKASGSDVIVSFTPHLMPMNRGILSTIYVKTKHDVATLKSALEKAYKDEPFVHVMPDKFRVFTHSVRGTNHCIMNVFADRVKGQAIIVCAIDNLMKGASGQAVQNMNVMYGFAETLGLEQSAIFP
jgi:N-acetyl-gamma-glutamyl-phosphate reductase